MCLLLHTLSWEYNFAKPLTREWLSDLRIKTWKILDAIRVSLRAYLRLHDPLALEVLLGGLASGSLAQSYLLLSDSECLHELSEDLIS